MSKRSKKSDKPFSGTSKQEVHEIRADLASPNKDKVKAALKRVISAYSVGTDVSQYFENMVLALRQPHMELKKLVYLFLAQYAHSNAEKVVERCGSTMQHDAQDARQPFLRALALRTLATIKSDKVADHLMDPLKSALRDRDPYVRKTAAVCVAKAYALNKQAALSNGIVDRLRDLISDPNPMVVANAVAGLAELAAYSSEDFFVIDPPTMSKLLTALNECTEWGQVFILDSMAGYRPSPSEAATIVERVIPRLQHSNSAVAMSAMRVVVNLLGFVGDLELKQSVLQTKLPPPLITLLTESPAEMQYVALRNINLIVQKWPQCLEAEVKHFFCKYNDPIYIKMEKLEIMITLATEQTIGDVVLEFREYAKEVDVEFVRKSVRAIGRCAIKLNTAAEKCVKVLLELIQTKVNYVVQEAIIVIKDIFRKYPNKYESIIGTLCENLDTLDEPEAKASMIWIIGEYAARIENVPALLEDFVDTFADENPRVQLQLLTAVVKFFLRKPEEAKDMVTQVLNLATDHSDNPDLRDRGYVYWRLLSTDPEAAQQVILADKPPISDDTFKLEQGLLHKLLANLGTLSAVYHKPPAQFAKGLKQHLVFGDAKAAAVSDDDESTESSESETDDDSDSESETDDEVAESDALEVKVKAQAPQEVDFLSDLAGDLSTDPAGAGGAAQAQVVLPFDNPKCPLLQVRTSYARRNGQLYMDLHVESRAQQPIAHTAIKFNKNLMGLQALSAAQVPGGVPPGGSNQGHVPLGHADASVNLAGKPGQLQVAIKTELGVAFFRDKLPLHLLLQEDAKVEQKQFIQLWKSLGDHEERLSVRSRPISSDALNATLAKNNVFYVAKRAAPGRGERLYASAKVKDQTVLLELILSDTGVMGAAKCNDTTLSKLALLGLADLLAR